MFVIYILFICIKVNKKILIEEKDNLIINKGVCLLNVNASILIVNNFIAGKKCRVKQELKKSKTALGD